MGVRGEVLFLVLWPFTSSCGSAVHPSVNNLSCGQLGCMQVLPPLL